MNKSIEGTADDEEEGVSPDTAIRSGLELLKVLLVKLLDIISKLTAVNPFSLNDSIISLEFEQRFLFNYEKD